MKFTLYLFGRRSIAYCIDALIVGLLVSPHILVRVFVSSGDLPVPIVLDILSIVLSLIYYVGCHTKWGRTLGKAAVRLRVATKEGLSPLPGRQSFARYTPFLIIALAAFIFDWFVYPYSNFGYVWVGDEAWSVVTIIGMVWVFLEVCYCLKSRGHRSLHDLIGGTVVTYEHARRNDAAKDSAVRNVA